MAKSGIKVATQHMGHEGGTTSIGEEIIKKCREFRTSLNAKKDLKKVDNKLYVLSASLILLVDNYL